MIVVTSAGCGAAGSLPLTLLFQGHNELPGFYIMSQEELLGELLHLGGHVQVFALYVRGEGVLEAGRHKNIKQNGRKG